MTALAIRKSGLDDDISSALEREKSLFMGRNADRCSHLGGPLHEGSVERVQGQLMNVS